MWRRSALGLAAALVVCGALTTNGASAAAKHGTSVSLQIASNGHAVSGRVRSSKAACVKHRALRLQKREGRKWVTVAKLKSSGSGRFKRSLKGTGKYRVLASAKGSCGGGTSSPVTASPGSSGSSSAPCRMALTHDTYDGFHIAIPTGWELSTLRGELEVQKDVAADEAVLVWPGIQTSGLTPSSFFQSQLSNFEAQSSSEGRPITITGNHSKGGVPSVTFTAPVNGQTVHGYATVMTQQYMTALSSAQVAFVAYWAPSAAFNAETATLSGVAACYGPERASIYHVFQDQAFTYMMPPGWSVSNESQDALDLIDGRGDYVTFELVGGNQFNSPQSLINVFLAGDQIGPVNALWTASTPSQQVQNGATQSSEYEEFTAPWRGQQVHGLIFALTDVGIGFNTGVVRIVLSTADGWNAVNGALIQMVGAIQHKFTQDLQEIQQLNQQWQNFSNQVANFDDILNNQQLTQDPTTGIYYYAPYDSYEVDGPNGPGYYENDQKLNIINRQ